MSVALDQLLLPVTAIAMMTAVIIAIRVLRRAHDRRDDEELAGWERTEDEDTYRVAAAQLDTADIALQLPAVQMLESLGQSSDVYRQSVVDLLCGHLRRPPGDATERTVRRAAQQVVANLVADGAGQGWGPLALDLGGATLIDLDLSDVHLRVLTCTNARFEGETILRAARIIGPARLAGAVFGGVLRSEDVDFEDVADFTDVVFQSEVSFSRCTFRRAARFAGATFAGPANLSRVVFLAAAAFSHPVDGPAWFRDVVDFRDSCFTAAAFDGVAFPEGVDVGGSEWAHPLPAERLHPTLRAALRRIDGPPPRP